MSPASTSFSPGRKLAVMAAVFVGILILLRVSGMIRLFSVPTGSMTPAVAAGDHIVVEGVSYLLSKPRRGDAASFRTDGIPMTPPGQIYLKRIAGLPVEHLSLSNGALYIDDHLVALSNSAGEIHYSGLPGVSPPLMTNLTIPAGQYFVLGDYSANSLDSRMFGCVPAGNILGRGCLCYWPPTRVGTVK